MEKRKEAFELVLHIDEDGARATGSYRTRYYDDEGKLDTSIQPKIEGVTLAELGDAFPWSDFIPAATQGALLKVENAEAALKQALGAVDDLKARIRAVIDPPSDTDGETRTS